MIDTLGTESSGWIYVWPELDSCSGIIFPWNNFFCNYSSLHALCKLWSRNMHKSLDKILCSDAHPRLQQIHLIPNDHTTKAASSSPTVARCLNSFMSTGIVSSALTSNMSTASAPRKNVEEREEKRSWLAMSYRVRGCDR